MRFIPAIFCALSIAGCGSATTKVLPSSGSLLPNYAVQITPSIAYTVEQVAMAGVAGGLVYLVYDPLAPNWQIEERLLGDETYAFSLRAKSFRVGGDGEAMQVVKRRALELQRQKGFGAYKILSYSEGVESSTPLTRRIAESSIQLVKATTGSVR